ncbi:unnamed protein product [Psylliodes chrysocephalus]|uniref:Uncharacterized protein n=1 Tax=Psylliodes chrysocephalus TaxID=3402493 RepID=A0A9P0DC10_9CUCU|nr:unnamed protein product [Psylliodes chrysocephala]
MLKTAKTWFSCNNLKLNESKTQNIVFSSDKWSLKSEPAKLLGITLDTSLNWSNHIDNLCGRLSSQIFAMRQLRTSLDNKTITTVYYAMVHSVMSYGILLWGNAPNSFKVFNLQKAAVRTIDMVPYDAHCGPLFHKYRILPLPCVYVLESLVFIHKNIKNLKTHSDIHSYNTRNGQNLIVPFSRIRSTQVNKIDLNLYNKFICIHNDNTIKSMSINSFKKLAKNFLLKHCFYSVNDFKNFIM